MQHAAPAGTSLDEGADAVRAVLVVGEGVAAHWCGLGIRAGGVAVQILKSFLVDEWLRKKEIKPQRLKVLGLKSFVSEVFFFPCLVLSFIQRSLEHHLSNPIVSPPKKQSNGFFFEQ